MGGSCNVRALAAAGLAALMLSPGCRREATVDIEELPVATVGRRARPRIQMFKATAYTIDGITASGVVAREGIVAADPKVLPLGSRVRIHDAGPYSGVYRVADTGRKVRGRAVDIYIRDDAEARRFGKRRVRVERLD